ncbi:MAG: AI-2E family transporter [Psychroflexus sp.]|uniref:AI-2E family transporter n=2 Tax=Mesohalobacter halotolerans TaxID=1883405 RepID=A0A4U5TRG2_9FLAO|nr:AI-2E family transporter [Psychroflexus sp.]TKS56391.1 AI-2E family transporter [Mesohalobacter halotolerans]
MKTIPPRVIRQIFLMSVIIILAIIIYNNILPYISGILGAITFFVISRKIMKRLNAKGWPKSLSAGLIIVGSFILILIPLAGVIFMLSSKIGEAIKNSEKFVVAAKTQLAQLEQYTGYNLSQEIDTSGIASFISKNAQNLALGTFDAFISISIMYFLLYYMLINQEQLKTSLQSYIPVGKKNLKTIGIEATKKVKANAIGIPLVAFIQGVIALIGYLIFGVPDPFFWFAVTAIGSVIPFIGTAIGFIPVTVILLSQGMTLEAIGVLAYGVIVVGSSDNIVRLYVLKRMANEHPLITLIGVIVGIPVFGFLGLVFGPLLISLFLIIVVIYKEEYANETDTGFNDMPSIDEDLEEQQELSENPEEEIKEESNEKE